MTLFHHEEHEGVFLDISKAFDRVWHEDGPLLSLLSNFLSSRYQRVVLNGKAEWKQIESELNYCSVVFFKYNLPNNIESKPKDLC